MEFDWCKFKPENLKGVLQLNEVQNSIDIA